MPSRPLLSKKVRNWIFAGHRYVGLAIGLVLAIVGLTGSLLVFHTEIHDIQLHHEIGYIAPQGEPLSPDALVEKVKAAYANQPDIKMSQIYLSGYNRLYQNEVAPLNVAVEGKDDLWIENYVHPYTGEILSQHQWQGSFWGNIYELHYQLLAGDWGMYFVGVVGLLAFFLCITGIALWPGWRKLSAGFKIKWNGHPKRKHFDIHKVAGIVAAMFLALATSTGFLWNFWDWSEPAVYAVTFSQKPADPVSKPIPGKTALSISEALHKSDAALPNGKTIAVALPNEPEGVFEIRKQLPGDANYWGEHYVYLDQYTGDVIRMDTTSTNSFGTKLLNATSTVHYGTFAGIPSRLLYVFVGLSPTILLITGFIMWHHRRRTKVANPILEKQ